MSASSFVKEYNFTFEFEEQIGLLLRFVDLDDTETSHTCRSRCTLECYSHATQHRPIGFVINMHFMSIQFFSSTVAHLSNRSICYG
jgi:hypothetical protein